MFQVEVDIFKTRCKIKHWSKYRDVTRLEEERAIQSLERELAYMIDNYVVLSSIPLFLYTNKINTICSFRIFGKKYKRRTFSIDTDGTG